LRTVPFSYRGYPSSAVAVQGFIVEPGEQPVVEYNEVGSGYLSTTGIPMMAGREFTTGDTETTQPVAIVNETMAQRFWRGGNPVGQRFQVMKDRWLQVAGVAKNSKYGSLLETAKPFFYIPVRQGSGAAQSFQVRTRLAPEALANTLLREIKTLDANLAPGEVITMREQVDRKSWSQRAAVSLLATFSAIALLLAGVGLYGVMSYSVSQSTRELGLRMALGASISDLLRIVMSHGLRLTFAGIAAGAALSLGLTRLMGDMLYKVSPRDPVPFGLAFVIMTVAALAASFFPALRATRTDPVRALRD
jgi:putative ABC transport system permease protein